MQEAAGLVKATVYREGWQQNPLATLPLPKLGCFVIGLIVRKQINSEKQIMFQINPVYCFLREKSTLECQSPMNNPSKSQTRTGKSVRAEGCLMIKFLCI